MRISHSDLESCRRNPKQWIATRLASGKNSYSYGYNRALRDAIYAYHKSTEPLKGSKHLFDKLKRFKDAARKADCEQSLRLYLRWAEETGVIVAQCKVRLQLQLASDVILGGEISRVDIDTDTDTYRAVIFGDRKLDWKSELRFPLIQHEIGRIYQRSASKVRVGYQQLDGGDLQVLQFGKRQIEEALDEAEALGESIQRELGTNR